MRIFIAIRVWIPAQRALQFVTEVVVLCNFMLLVMTEAHVSSTRVRPKSLLFGGGGPEGSAWNAAKNTQHAGIPSQRQSPAAVGKAAAVKLCEDSAEVGGVSCKGGSPGAGVLAVRPQIKLLWIGAGLSIALALLSSCPRSG